MALRGQPYIPLYVLDFMTDERVRDCSAESVGVYIMLMCIMHRSDVYGTIYIKDKYIDIDKDNILSGYAEMLNKQLPYGVDVIKRSLSELIKEGILHFGEGQMYIYQKRMVRDNDISEKRANAGKGGMGNRWTKNDTEKSGFLTKNDDKTVCYNKNIAPTKNLLSKNDEFCYNKNPAPTENLLSQGGITKSYQNTENEYENEIEYENDSYSSTQTQKTKNSVIDEMWQEFWKEYPRKSGKGGAEKKFKKIAPSEELFAEMMSALHLAKQTEQWTKDKDKKFIPYPVTWLNQQRWEDEYVIRSGTMKASDIIAAANDDNPFAEYDEE